MLSDEELMIAASRGDMHAFEHIVLRYRASVWRAACRFLGDAEEARDITQSVFLKLFESAGRYHRTATFKTYLFRIVYNTCIDHTRKKRPFHLSDTPDVPGDSPSAVDVMIKYEKEKRIKQAIETLPLRQRSAITLRYEAELSVGDIANILKVTEKAVERLLAHARDTLFTMLKNNRAH